MAMDTSAALAPLDAAIVDPNAFTELGFSILVLVVIIVLHGWGLSRVTSFFSGHFALYSAKTALWRISALTSATITLLVLLHLIETLLWTTPFFGLGVIPNFSNAYYFVLEAYTTLGEGNVLLPPTWRLAGPIIAISGLFTFGWTGSVLVYVMNEIGKLHATRSRIAARAAAAPEKGEAEAG
jgi:hypothetical protein